MPAEILSDLSRATDGNSDPLAGAQWFFYATGTLTPQAVYTTAALSVEHANPVVADAGGQFAAIYFDASLQYRGVLKDAGGGTIRDIDPINSGAISLLAGSAGAGEVGFIQTGTGAVARTVLEKARETVSVFDFGAVGDGVTDDTAAINYAIATGKNVVFPSGYTFLTSGLHEIDTNGQRIIIDGTVKYDGVRRFIATGVYGFQGLFRVLDQTENVSFEGSGAMDGNWRRAGANGSQPLQFRDAGSGIYAYRASGLRVEGLTFQHFSENGVKALNCPAINIGRTCTFFDICNIGVEIYSYVNDPRTGVAWVGDVAPPSGSVDGYFDLIDDGEFFGNYGNGVGVSFQSAPSALPVRNLRVGGQYRDCLAAIWSENNSSEAINIVIDAPRIEGNYRGAGSASTLSGIGLIGVKNSQVISPVIYNVGNVAPASGSQSAGMHIVECDGISIVNPTIIDDTGAANRTQFGIRINAGTNIMVRGGVISGVSSSKILQANSPTNVRLENVRGAADDETWGNLVKFTFALQNVPASAGSNLLAVGEAGVDKAIFPCPGRVVAMTARFSGAHTGSWTISPLVSATAQTDLNITQADFGGGAVDGGKRRSTESAAQYAAFSRLEVTITTDGSWTATNDVVVDVWVDIGMKA